MGQLLIGKDAHWLRPHVGPWLSSKESQGGQEPAMAAAVAKGPEGTGESTLGGGHRAPSASCCFAGMHIQAPLVKDIPARPLAMRSTLYEMASTSSLPTERSGRLTVNCSSRVMLLALRLPLGCMASGWRAKE